MSLGRSVEAADEGLCGADRVHQTTIMIFPINLHHGCNGPASRR
jgi:hypothetical protein